jgi:cystathionine gamma-synthase
MRLRTLHQRSVLESSRVVATFAAINDQAAATSSEEGHSVQSGSNGVGSAGSSSSVFPSSSTECVHNGEREGRPKIRDALTTPIVQTSTYWFKDTEELIEYQEGRYKSYEYGRYGNPTVRVCEEKIAALEKAEECLVSSSGMNTATTMLLALVPQHGHIITTTDCYRRTRQFIQTFLAEKMNVTATVLDPSDLEGLEKALKENDVTLYFSESPTNPYLRCIDVPTVSGLCQAHGALCVVDSTFATPVNQKALELGADLVISSGTKYMAGHNDVLCGYIAGKKEVVAQVKHMQNILGGVMDPHAGYLLLRGMKTLELRILRQNENGMRLAQSLEAHPRVSKVHYPGLPSHPDHANAKSQMKGYGGVVSFEVDGDLWDTAKVIDGVKLPYIAPSLGGVESLIEQPTVVSYWDQAPEVRAEIGIKDNLIRYACGIENFEDLWNDLCQALDSF